MGKSKRILFVIPPSREMYSVAKVRVAVPERPSLTFATLAAPLIQEGHHVEIVDLNMEAEPGEALEKKLSDLRPDLVGITCTTPLVEKTKKIAEMVKAFDVDIPVVPGGAHPSAFPQETLRETGVDIVCVGEGDLTLPPNRIRR